MGHSFTLGSDHIHVFLGVVHLNQDPEGVLEIFGEGERLFCECKGFRGRRAIQDDDADILLDIGAGVIGEGFEGRGEELTDHEALGELIFEEIVAFAGKKVAELLYLERRVMEDSDPQLILLLAIHYSLYGLL